MACPKLTIVSSSPCQLLQTPCLLHPLLQHGLFLLPCSSTVPKAAFRWLSKALGHTCQGASLGRRTMAEPTRPQRAPHGHPARGDRRRPPCSALTPAPRCAARGDSSCTSGQKPSFFASLIRSGRPKHRHFSNDIQERPFHRRSTALISPAPIRMRQALPFLHAHTIALLHQRYICANSPGNYYF